MWARAAPAIVLLTLASVARAEDRPLELRFQTLFFADNTEFFGPFRTGETLLGAWARAFVTWPLSDHAGLDLGGTGRQQFGSEKAIEEARPVLALHIGSPASLLVFGTLDPGRATTALGPDVQTPHGLLPPLQIETLSFERPWEAGLQWKGSTDSRTHDAWLSWQRINTVAHRERLNAGFLFEKRRNRTFGLAQAHVVHEGGQLSEFGAVSDSFAAAAGVGVDVWRRGESRLSIFAAGVISAYEPDRSRAGDGIRGGGAFLRAVYRRERLRAHALYWHARDFVKVEGDPNYGVIRRDGSRFPAARDYFEAGVAREFRPAPSLRIEVSARVHAYEGEADYSYRVLASVDAARILRPLTSQSPQGPAKSAASDRSRTTRRVRINGTTTAAEGPRCLPKPEPLPPPARSVGSEGGH